MINELLYMNGYGIYVWSSFIFTFGLFTILYQVIKYQLVKERRKFELKFNSLSNDKIKLAKKQNTYKEILVNTSISKI